MIELKMDENLGNALSIATNREITVRQALLPSCINTSMIDNLREYVYKNLKEYIKYRFLHESLVKDIKSKYNLYGKNFAIYNTTSIQVEQ